MMGGLLGSASLAAIQAAYEQQKIAQQQSSQQQSLSQQLGAVTRAAFVPGAVTSITITNSGSGYTIPGRVYTDEPPPYESPAWIKAMHGTIDEIRAKGI